VSVINDSFLHLLMKAKPKGKKQKYERVMLFAISSALRQSN